MSSKISNVLGVPLPPWLRDQIMTRSKYNSLDDRSDNDNAIYLSGKTAWVRLVSSVDMINDADRNYFSNNYGLILNSKASLAKQFTLFAGSSMYMDANTNLLRNGINNLNNPYDQAKSAYGVLGKQEIYNFGYRPMPGLQNVNITTQGKLGSVRVATVNFKCWDKMQLDIMDVLYFKLGYTMYLEWGQTYFYPSRDFMYSTDDDATVRYAKGQLYSTDIFSIDPFQEGMSKEKINEYIAQSVQLSEGNYDAMLGMCTNFNFTYNQEGGYDCQIKLMSLGVLADSTKINHTSTISGVLDEQVKYYSQLLKIKKAEEEARKKAEEEERQAELKKELIALYGKTTVGANSGRRVIDNEDFEKYIKIKYDLTLDQFNEVTGLNIKENAPDASLINDPSSFSQITAKASDVKNVGQSVVTELVTLGQAYIDAFKSGKLYQWGSQDDRTEQSKVKWVYPSEKKKNADGKVYESYQLSAALPSLSSILKKDDADTTVNVSVGNILQSAGLKYSRTEDKKNLSLDTNAPSHEFAFWASRNFDRNSVLTTQDTPQNSITAWYKSLKPDPNPQKYYISITQTKPAYAVDGNPDRPKTTISVTVKGETVETDLDNLFEQFNNPVGIDDDLLVTNFSTFVYQVYELMDTVDFKLTINRPAIENKINATVDKTVATKGEVGYKVTDTSFSNLLKASGGTFVDTLAKSTDGFFVLEGYILQKRIYYTTTADSVDREGIWTGDVEIPVNTEVPLTIATPITIRSNDFSIISKVKPGKNSQQPIDFGKTQVTAADSSNVTAGTQEATVEEEEQAPTIDSVKSPLSFLSAIEVSLRAIQVHSLISVLEGGKDPTTVNYLQLYNEKTSGNTPFLKQIFANGIFQNILDGLIAGKWEGATYRGSDEDTKFAIKAQYGFATGLLAGTARVKDLNPVDYQLLLTSYILPYRVNQALEEGTPVEHPVYIPFGFFLMLLNHNCVLYDAKKEENKATPLSYIDFNPEHNFCLSNAQHLTTDPFTAFIPFEGEYKDFKEIIDPIVVNGDNIKAPTVAPPAEGDTGDTPKPPTTTPIWNAQSSNKDERDQVSAALRQAKGKHGSYSFKNEVNGGTQTYKGKIMNILLNIDYLMGLIKGSAGKSEENRVTLKPILEQIINDLNKCLGNINVFRVSYVDAGNVHQIVDDQILPPSGQESTLNSTNKEQQPLPLIGKESIAKSLDFKSEVSTKLANMIAISANSKNNQSTLGSSGDNFAGYINENFQDRYIPERSEPASNSGSLDGKINVAVQFNNAVKSFYNSLSPDPGSVSAATTYYVDRMAKLRGTNEATRASAMIPITLNFKTNGISGLAMGHAFTVPDGLLPYSYGKNSANATDRVGFVVTGLDHSIDGNVWDTSVKSQMIFLKDPNVYTTGKSIIARPSDAGLGAGSDNNVTFGGGAFAPTGEPTDCGCTRCYPGAYAQKLNQNTGKYEKQYYCTAQLEGGKTFNTNNFKDYHPNYVFKKGTSDIDLSKIGLKPLTESEIIDDTNSNKFQLGTITNDTNQRKFVFHHTAGRGTAQQVYAVFYGRGLPVQYVIDRDAKIHRFMPDGAKGQHASEYENKATFGYISNSTSMGVEIIASNNDDVTEAQAKAGVRLAQYLGFKKSQCFGHGTVAPPGQKALTEGKKSMDFLQLC